MPDSKSLKEALRHSPDNIPLLLLFAQACLGEFENEEARTAYERVLTLDPAHNDARLGVVRALFAEGHLSQAVVRLEDMVARNPRFAAAHALLGRVYFADGSPAKAVEHYRQAVKLDKNLVDPKLAGELGIDPSGQDETEAVASLPGGGTRNVPFGQTSEEPDEAPSLAIEKPDTNFSHVGGMEPLKEQIRMKILYPMTHADLFRAYKKNVGGGVLLYGPPGCGKTLISRATAGEIKANFFCIGLHDILDMWVGRSEKNLHDIFRLARENAPSVLFFDEIDALAADRKDLRQSASKTVINQFLAEMDGGVSNNSGVLILGATNAPWHIDSAFRRPGRFDRTIFVPPPDETARVGIIEVMAKDKPIAELDARALAKKTDGFSGADLKGVFDHAIELALTVAMKEGRLVPITMKTLFQAAKEAKPSTRAWFDSAKNYALYANQGGFYDDVLVHLGLKKS